MLEVEPVALHMHERISTKAILRTVQREDLDRDLFGDPQHEGAQAVQFYQHEMDWTNRMILGDCLQVMVSLAQREDLSGKVQMIYFDPPYGIKFNSNFQVKTNSRTVRDSEADLTREPEMIKAYRDTWRLGVHSYLTYLRDRLRAAKDLLHDTGSIFIQIGDENLQLVTLVADEIFGRDNKVQLITFKKKSSTQTAQSVADYILWYAKDASQAKKNKLYRDSRMPTDLAHYNRIELRSGERRHVSHFSEDERQEKWRDFVHSTYPVTSQDPDANQSKPIKVEGRTVTCGENRHWSFDLDKGMKRLEKANRLRAVNETAYGIARWGDGRLAAQTNVWTDTHGAANPIYVVQTNHKIVERCILMTTDPGDLVLDPTCGSGTTAYAAEKWGRRWITIDTSRVAISLARQRLMTASLDYFQLQDGERISSGFCYQIVGHITLKDIANNEQLDPIFDKHDPLLDKLLKSCNKALAEVNDAIRERLARKLEKKTRGKATDCELRRWSLPSASVGFKHWTMPFEKDSDWPGKLQDAVVKYRNAWRKKMDEVDECIKENSNPVELIDRPIPQPKVMRVSGPYSIDSVLPSEALSICEGSEEDRKSKEAANSRAYVEEIIGLLKKTGLCYPKNNRMEFNHLVLAHENDIIHAEGAWISSGSRARKPTRPSNVAVVCGPQYGPVTALQVENAVQSAMQHGYNELVIAGFSFDGAAQAAICDSEKKDLLIHISHINPDVNPCMAGLLKSPRHAQIFSVFGKPRVDVSKSCRKDHYTIKMLGVDSYNPIEDKTVCSDISEIAAWFIDTDYDERTFCSVQVFFPNQNAWEGIRKSLGSLSNVDAFEKLEGFESLPFTLGRNRTVAIKVIDFRGNEMMVVRKIS